MKKQFLGVLFLLACLAATGCRRQDVRQFTIEIPEMTEADRPAIEASLAMYAGVDKPSMRFDFAARTLSLSYDSMQIAKKNIEMAIAGAGFTANGVTPRSIGKEPRHYNTPRRE